MDRIRRDTLLGLVFFGTLAFLLWATVNLTDVAVDRNRVGVWFPQAGSCEVGTNVMVLGKKIGKVGAIDIDYERAERPVRMTLLLREPIPLRRGCRILVRDAGVLGGKQVYIEPGRTGELLPLDGDFIGEVEPGAFEQIGNIAKGEGEVGTNLNRALRNIGDFFERMVTKDNPGTVSKLLNDPELYDRLNDSVGVLRKLLESLEQGDGMIGHLIMNGDTRNTAVTFLTNLKTLSDRLLSAEAGTLGMLINDPTTATNLSGVVGDLRQLAADLLAKKGVVGRLLQDEAMGTQLESIAYNLELLSGRLVDPKAGAIGALTSDPATGEDIRLTLGNFRHLTDQLRRSDGLIGALINDPDLAIRFRRILTQVSRAIEDAREAAPIGNFVQVLLGTF
jgi:phospholipid/cholesterol/gamma-HCH transport system substrate-binding protein